MITITDADREAAKLLRDVLADISGFWHKVDDDSALCAALAHHRSRAEKRMLARTIRAEPRHANTHDLLGASSPTPADHAAEHAAISRPNGFGPPPRTVLETQFAEKACP